MLTTCSEKMLSSENSHTIVVRDGDVTQTRRAIASDFHLVQEFHERCTQNSRSLRYHGGKVSLTPREWKQLVDPRRGVTLLTHLESHPDQVIAMANLMQLVDEPGVLELAVLVEDAWQRRLLGREIFVYVRTLARSAGYHALCVSILSSNRQLISAIQREVPLKTSARQGTSVEIRIPLTAVPEVDQPT
jgi:GNAT superfamily N-acetyltransferase